MKLIFGYDDAIARIVGEGLGQTIHPPYTCIGVVDWRGNVKGGFVFNGFNGSNIEMTAWLDSALTRGLIRAVMHYAFIQLGCNRLSARTKRSNKPVQSMLPRAGLRYEATLKQYFGPEKKDDAILYCINRETALRKWLNHGQP